MNPSPNPPPFRHTDTATPEAAWLADLPLNQVEITDPATLLQQAARLVVLSAHPDDEAIAVGGLIQAAGQRGMPTLAVTATLGENSHPHATAFRPDLLRALRHEEFRTALKALHPAVHTSSWDIPDGAVRHHRTVILQRLHDVLQPGDLVLVPWSHDGHADHDALAEATLTVARDRPGVTVLQYPVWAWHWMRPEHLPWQQAVLVELSLPAISAKRDALEVYRSQLRPLGPGAGDQPVVGEGLRAVARRPFEILLRTEPSTLPRGLRTSTQADAFDAMYQDGDDDPWQFASSPYERRKRRLALACLGRQHYETVIEVGCANGVFTQELASHAGRVIAIDVSEAATRVARRHTPAHVEVRRGAAPLDLPTGPADLIVLSEVGYFLTPAQLLATYQHIRRALTPGGELLLVNWTHPTADIPLNGELTHELASACLGQPWASYSDGDMRIEVFRPNERTPGPAGSPPTGSPAPGEC